LTPFIDSICAGGELEFEEMSFALAQAVLGGDRASE